MRGTSEEETHQLDRSVPRARNKGVFCDGTPADRVHFPLVLVEVHDRELVDGQVEQLDGPIATGHEELVLVDLRPGEIILGVVSVEAAGTLLAGKKTWLARGGSNLPLPQLDAGSRQFQDVRPAIAHDAIVCRCSHGHA